MRPGHALFRADASTTVGTGHVVRSRTLAQALIARGWTATLATRGLPSGFAVSLTEIGVRILELDGDASPPVEVEAIAAATQGSRLVITDHYRIGSEWLTAMRRHTDGLMAIDDLADRPLPVDLLVNQNLGVARDGYAALVSAGAVVLTGPQYALVRPEFADRRARGRDRTGRIDRILVFISGADPHDVTGRAFDGLIELGVAVDVVVGSAYPHLEHLRARVEERPAAELHVNVDTMADLMDAADLAIGAPSSASWERCTVGLPAVLVAVADNQLTTERELVAAGAAVSAGWHTRVTSATVRDLVRSLRSEPNRVARMSRAATAVTDGRGTDRVVAEIERLDLPLREAR